MTLKIDVATAAVTRNLMGMQERSRVRRALGVAVAAVVAQQALTEYPDPGPGPHLIWGGLSLLLLYGVDRGSRAARGAFLVLALLGVGIFVWGGVDGRTLALALACGTQASVMLMPSVRSWTRREPLEGQTRPISA